MSERLTSNYEKSPDDIAEAAAERSKELIGSAEQASGERLLPNAEREKVESLFSKEASSERKKASLDGDSPAPLKPLPKKVSKSDRKSSYKQTMTHVQNEMSVLEKTFSKVIHTPVIEKTSEVLGATVARPNAILAGSFSAFVLTMVVYVIARNMGYGLSGFETIAAFLIGWAIGLIYDYARIMISGGDYRKN